MNTSTAQEVGQVNEVNLCDSCCHFQPVCECNNLIFGTGLGDDNIIACDGYEPIELRHPKYVGQEL